ncbi:hypothetical protein LTS17_004855 [Exophiala oligosperma]
MASSKIEEPNDNTVNRPDDVVTKDNTNEHVGAERAPAQKATLFMIFFAIWISFASWIANFDLGYQGVVLIMPTFNNAFGPGPTGAPMEVCQLSVLRQSLSNVVSIFTGVGGVLAGITGHYIGRRGTMQLASAIVIIGAASMLGTSNNFLHYMVCKCISGVGIGQLLASSLVYGTECIVASQRGLILGMYNYGLALGNVAAAAVCAGSSHLAATNNWQWKTPIICQIPLGIILAAGTMMFPESPYWLMTKDREEAARTSFAQFYKKDPSSAEITAQVQSVKEYIEIERAASATTSWTEIYHSHDIRRTFASTICLLGVSLTGINLVAPYAALFLHGLGITNPYLINVIIGLCIFAGALLGPVVLEYGGRRFSMLCAFAAMASCMLIFSAVSSALGPNNPQSQRVLVAFLCIWAFVFGGGFAPAAWLTSAELHSVRLRTYGQANTTFFYQIFQFGATFWTPYMLNKDYGDMGTNVGYFYFGITVVWFILVFLFVPETARLTLEQIDDYYMSSRPAWKTSMKVNKQIAMGNNTLGATTHEAKNGVDCVHSEKV